MSSGPPLQTTSRIHRQMVAWMLSSSRNLREKRLLLAELRMQSTSLKTRLQADLDSGRRSDPRIMLEFIERWERFEALLE